ncbi:MAG: hypothetical protein ACRECR_06635, partial [Thermoplasmata archaeon]
MRDPTFELVELDRLRVHEEIDAPDRDGLVERLRREGRVQEPIWVARGSLLVLNGHHRLSALRALGARRAPAWMFDYDDPRIHLGRWGEGPELTKEMVLRRARSGRPFPAKTTRHTVDFELPPHPTPLSELLTETSAPPIELP